MARQSLTFSVGNLREVVSCSKFSASISIFWKRTSALQLSPCFERDYSSCRIAFCRWNTML